MKTVKMCVLEVMRKADRPLTLDEVTARVRLMRPDAHRLLCCNVSHILASTHDLYSRVARGMWEFRRSENGCLCQKCGRMYHIDLLVPDALWEQINPDRPEGFKEHELLCGECIMGLLEGTLSFHAFRLVESDAEIPTCSPLLKEGK